jgi:hypothetical protein
MGRLRVDFGAHFHANSLMPRKLRIEYPGAMDHVMSRENQRFEPKVRWNVNGKRTNIWVAPFDELTHSIGGKAYQHPNNTSFEMEECIGCGGRNFKPPSTKLPQPK